MKVRALILPVVLMGLAACQPSKPEAEVPTETAQAVTSPEVSAEVPSAEVLAPETSAETPTFASEPEKPKVEPHAAAPATPAPAVPVQPTVVAAAPAIQPGVLPAGNGRNVAQRLCSSCHSLVLLTATGHTEAEWDSIVARMENNGMTASPEDIDTVITYLGKALPPR